MASGVRNPSSVSKWCRTSSRPGCSEPRSGERVVEDHRTAVPVGVEEPDRAFRRRQHVLGDRHHRRDATAAAEADQWACRLSRAEDARRFGELNGVARREVVEEPVGDQAARHPLDGDGQFVVGRRRTGHGVRPQLFVAVDVHAEGAELPGPVAKGLGRVLGDVEDEGAGVVGLARRPGRSGASGTRGRAGRGSWSLTAVAGRPTGASATPRTWSRGTGRSRPARSGGRSRCACSPRRACRPDRSACRR